MMRTKLSLTFSYIRTFNFTKIDLMVGPVIIVIMTIIMIVTLVNSTTVPILIPIWVISPISILGIKFCTRCNFLIIRVIPTFIRRMGLATNLTRNIWFPINLISIIMRNLTLSLTMPFCDIKPVRKEEGKSYWKIGVNWSYMQEWFVCI